MKIRIIAALMVAFFMLPFLGVSAYAAELDPDPIMAAPLEKSPEEDAPPIAEALPIPATEGPVIPEAEPIPFTPAGVGTVVDYATDADGKQFYTIMTPAENVFYLVIDRQRGTENVYFLNAVTEADLLALAEISPAPTAPQTSPAPVKPEPTPEQPPAQGGGNMGTVILIVAVMLVGVGAGWYFKIYKPKQQKADAGDDYDYHADEGNPYGEDTEQEDDGLPPWEDDDESVGEDE